MDKNISTLFVKQDMLDEVVMNAQKTAHWLFIIIISYTLSSCATHYKMQGVVKDIFGNPISQVKIWINNTNFQTISNEKGEYSIDYVPGKFDLHFKKAGYTSEILNFELHAKDHIPVSPVKLHPIPLEKGLYLIDYDKKKIVVLNLDNNVNRKTERGRNDNYDLFGHVKQKYYITRNKGVNIPAGTYFFIDSFEEPLIFFQIRENGLFLSFKTGIAGKIEEVIHDGSIKHETSEVGIEKLNIRKLILKKGVYAAVSCKPFTDVTGRNYLIPSDNSFTLTVDGADLNVISFDDFLSYAQNTIVGAVIQGPTMDKNGNRLPNAKMLILTENNPKGNERINKIRRDLLDKFPTLDMSLKKDKKGIDLIVNESQFPVMTK